MAKKKNKKIVRYRKPLNINIGLIIIVILFQEQIKKFLVELGSKKRWGFFRNIFSRKTEEGKCRC